MAKAETVRLLQALAVAAAVVVPASALAAGDPACNTTDQRPAAVARDWQARRPIAALDLADVAAARCFQTAFLNRLKPTLGAPIGVKVGVWSKAGQARYGAPGPLLGHLYRRMLVPEGQAVPADYGVAPAWEADLLVVVGDRRINTASTREGIYKSLRAIRPFIELTNANYAPDVKINALQLEALNVGARMGVAGKEAKLLQSPKGMADFVGLQIETSVKSPAGDTVERARAVEALGDPIDIVRFARDAALAQGRPLKAGDVISLGVFTPAKPPRPNDVVTVRYTLGDRTPSVSTRFK